jgi:hypothetical protein
VLSIFELVQLSLPATFLHWVGKSVEFSRANLQATNDLVEFIGGIR